MQDCASQSPLISVDSDPHFVYLRSTQERNAKGDEASLTNWDNVWKEHVWGAFRDSQYYPSPLFHTWATDRLILIAFSSFRWSVLKNCADERLTAGVACLTPHGT